MDIIMDCENSAWCIYLTKKDLDRLNNGRPTYGPVNAEIFIPMVVPVGIKMIPPEKEEMDKKECDNDEWAQD